MDDINEYRIAIAEELRNNPHGGKPFDEWVMNTKWAGDVGKQYVVAKILARIVRNDIDKANGASDLGALVDRITEEWEGKEKLEYQQEIGKLQETILTRNIAVSLIDIDIDRVRANARSSKWPKELIQGWIVLTVFTLSGVVLPMLFLPQDDSAFGVGHKILVVGGFGLGLVMVAWYLVQLARKWGSEVG